MKYYLIENVRSNEGGDSPDTHNLDSYKGLIKNQLYILKRNLGFPCNPPWVDIVLKIVKNKEDLRGDGLRNDSK